MQAFTKRQIASAYEAKSLYAKLAYPSIKDFEWAVISNQIQDCPITKSDIKNAQAIWGKDVAALKGKTVRSHAPAVKGVTLKVPKEFLQLNKDVFLTMDIFFVNKQIFFLTLSRKIDFTAVNHLSSRKAPEIFKAFKDIYKYYLQRGFRITEVHADNEFGSLRSYIQDMPRGPRLNLASANEHVPEIERRIRLVKERTRAIRHGLPFERLPSIMTVHIVLNVVKLLTYFPTKGGTSQLWSPRMIMAGKPLNFKKDLALEFGAYCQVHAHHMPRNSMKPRTQGGICLGPIGNEQGGYRFMSLQTGAKFTGFKWTQLPIPESVIKRVNTLGKDQPRDLVFFDRHGNPIEDADTVQIAGVDGDTEDVNIEDDQDIADELQEIAEQEETDNAIRESNGEVIELQDVQPAQQQFDEPMTPDPEPIVQEAPQVRFEEPEPEPVAETQVRRSTREKRRPNDYVPSMKGKKYSNAQFDVFDEMQKTSPTVVATIMTQLSMRAGLKAWGEPAKRAVKDEMSQLHFRDTFRPRHWKDLTKEEKARLLESHLFLKKKRCGKIKGRTVAGGNKQRGYISKEDSSSPTVSTQSLLLTCLIDAHEGRDVMTIDIPNAFIQTRVQDPKQRALIKIKGLLVDTLVEIAPKVYKPFVHNDPKGNKVIIAECMNAIYGTMVASLLYYNKFCNTLKRLGFKPNPYDACVYNKPIGAKQQTVCFHVDNLKASHVDPNANTKLAEELRKEYEHIMEDGTGQMVVHRGSVHEYLGMTLDYSTKGVCKITMPNTQKKSLNKLRITLKSVVATNRVPHQEIYLRWMKVLHR